MIRFYTLLRRLDAPTTMFFYGLYTLLWGLWLLNPWVSSFSPDASPVFYRLSLVGHEEYWGLLAVLIGGGRLLTLFTNRVGLKQIINLAGLVFWLFIMITYVQSSLESTASVAAFVAVLSYGLAFLRIGID